MNRQEWITELQHRINASRGQYYEFVDLPIEDTEEIIALLKEQEHERLKVTIRHRNNDGYCPSCGKCIVMDFCPNNCGFCGQAVKWE